MTSFDGRDPFEWMDNGECRDRKILRRTVAAFVFVTAAPVVALTVFVRRTARVLRVVAPDDRDPSEWTNGDEGKDPKILRGTVIAFAFVAAAPVVALAEIAHRTAQVLRVLSLATANLAMVISRSIKFSATSFHSVRFTALIKFCEIVHGMIAPCGRVEEAMYNFDVDLEAHKKRYGSRIAAWVMLGQTLVALWFRFASKINPMDLLR